MGPLQRQMDAALKLAEAIGRGDQVEYPQARMYSALNGCLRPPTGWFCTREAGHSGPCAAWQEQP